MNRCPIPRIWKNVAAVRDARPRSRLLRSYLGGFQRASGGKQLDFGVASGATVFTGSQVVQSGGTASATTVLSGGTEIVSAHGSDFSARISGGIELDFGLAGGATIYAGSQVVESAGTASNTTVSSGGTLDLLKGSVVNGAAVASGGTLVASGLATVSGTLSLNGTTTVSSGAILQTASKGTVVLGGTVANYGTLFASGAGSLVDIASGAVVNGGGIAEVGNGIVDIQANGDNQNVSFLSRGSGGLELADTAANPSAFGGRIVGFGKNTKQFIDLTAVASAAGVSLSYSSNTSSSGVLTVLSGGTVVASINFFGSYTTSSFHITSGTGGTVEIFDPPAEPQKDTELATDSKHHLHLSDPFIAGSSDPSLLRYEPKDRMVSMFSWDHGSQSEVSAQSEALASFAPVEPENLLFSSSGSIAR
jgi:autotransporter passenger strand-loop-strand repeat protein